MEDCSVMYDIKKVAPAGTSVGDPGPESGVRESIHVVGLGGSLSSSSTSLSALKLALAGARDAGAAITILDIRTLNLPLYEPGLRVLPDQVRVLLAAVCEADGFIWSSPQYHGTISGSFKNALDWLDVLEKRDPPHLTDKIVGLISAAGGSHALQAINTMEFIVRAMRGLAIPLVVPISKAQATFDETGRIVDPKIETQLRRLGSEVVRLTRQLGPGQERTAKSPHRTKGTERVDVPQRVEVR
jgi:FMN reductase